MFFLSKVRRCCVSICCVLLLYNIIGEAPQTGREVSSLAGAHRIEAARFYGFHKF